MHDLSNLPPDQVRFWLTLEVASLMRDLGHVLDAITRDDHTRAASLMNGASQSAEELLDALEGQMPKPKPTQTVTYSAGTLAFKATRPELVIGED